MLAEISLPVQEGDAYQGNVQIGGGTQSVAGQNTQSTA